MRRGTILAAVVIALVIVVGPAVGAAPDGAAGPWADFIVDVRQGPAINPSGPVLPDRSDPTQALGPAESPPGNDDPIPTGTFFSLGFGGTLTVGFDNPICNVPGNDVVIDVREITMEPFPPERAQVYVSDDNVDYYFAGTVTKDGSVPMPSNLQVANFVRLVDVSNPADFANIPFADGFDVDGVRAVNQQNCPPGTLEICKASTNGMSNLPFQFSLNGGTPFTVRGGRCSGPITAPAGLNRLRELPSTPATAMSNVLIRPSGRTINLTLPSRTFAVKVQPGSTVAGETKITVTNEPANGATGDLKVCKVSEAPSFWGRLFSFRVNGGPLVSTEANPAFDNPANWSCRLLGTFTAGTRVTVQEQIPTDTDVAFIDIDPADRLVDFDTTTGTAIVDIGSGANVVLYDDEPRPPAKRGFVEVCKDAARLAGTPDPFVLGQPFSFHIDDGTTAGHDVSVLGGQCSGPVGVNAGVVRVTEKSTPLFRTVDTFTIPEERLLDSNLINDSADVEVPTSDTTNDETQIHFVNVRERGELKVCKALGPASGVLAGRVFTFDVVDTDDTNDHSHAPVSITSATSTQCVIVDAFPVGHHVQVTETNPPPYVTVSGEGTTTIASGTNTVTVTNTAQGKLEICKFVTDPLSGNEAYHEFKFRIDSGAPIRVRANRCAPEALVSVGSHTVSEDAELNYELNPDPALGNGIVVTSHHAETSRNLLGRSVTVTVPWAGDPEFEIGRDVRVDYYNRIRLAQLKVCKHIETGSEEPLGTKEFNFSISAFSGSGYIVRPLKMEECALVMENGEIATFPVILGNGTPNRLTVSEVPGNNFVVSNETVQGARSATITCSGTPRTCSNTVSLNPGPNTNTVHFTNRAT